MIRSIRPLFFLGCFFVFFQLIDQEMIYKNSHKNKKDLFVDSYFDFKNNLSYQFF
jgi:hypothetical protein